MIWSFSNGSRRNEVNLIDAVPARCADLISQEEVDFALVPVIEYQRIAGGRLVRDVCVGSRERVRSVVLVSRLNNLKKVRTVALDQSSRTSATLVKIIFKEFLGFEPAWTTRLPDIQQMLRENDAALIIGDPGMGFTRNHLHVWDLAALWKENTGLGFVFAMWMAGEHSSAEAPDFNAARDEGLEKVAEIVDEYVKKIQMPAEDIREYLSKNIVFEVDENLRAGMESYFQLARKYDLIDELKPLRFLD